mgnify:CR=1 FL=1
MYSKIKNPQTNRLVNITSKSGKSLLKKYLQKLYGGGGNVDDNVPNYLKELGEKAMNKKEKICSINIEDNICDKVLPIYDSNLSQIIKNLEEVPKNLIQTTLKTIWNDEEYIFERYEPIGKEEEGSFGIVKNAIFKNKKTNKEIVLIEKQRMNKKKKLDELDITKQHTVGEGKAQQTYEKTLNECSNIIPFKIINNKFYMLKGHGTLYDLALNAINNGLPGLSISFADKIINCLADTLLCLYNNGVYYFDIKIENIVYMCVDNVITIWFIDLGSIIPIKKDINILYNQPQYVDSYVCTYPHPIFNSYIFGLNKNISNYITPDLLPFTLNIYSYLLSYLFIVLIGRSTREKIDISWKEINKKSFVQIREFFRNISKNIENSDYIKELGSTEKDILQKHYDTYNEITKQLETFTARPKGELMWYNQSNELIQYDKKCLKTLQPYKQLFEVKKEIKTE